MYCDKYTLSVLVNVFQYDDAYIPRKLSNWESPKLFDEVRKALYL